MKIWIDKELFQWEKNRYVHIETMENEPAISYIQFYNKKSVYGSEIPLKDNKAKIPDILLTECLPIMAVACTGLEGYTYPINRREFKVIKRAKPENYVDSSDEIKDIIYDGGVEI